MPHRHDTAYGFRLALRSAGTTAEHYVTQGGLDAAAEPYIDAMMTASPVGLRLSKECPNMSVDAGSIEAVIAMEDRNQVLCSRSEEFSEGIRAFLEKRKPVYIKR